MSFDSIHAGDTALKVASAEVVAGFALVSVAS